MFTCGPPCLLADFPAAHVGAQLVFGWRHEPVRVECGARHPVVVSQAVAVLVSPAVAPHFGGVNGLKVMDGDCEGDDRPPH